MWNSSLAFPYSWLRNHGQIYKTKWSPKFSSQILACERSINFHNSPSFHYYSACSQPLRFRFRDHRNQPVLQYFKYKPKFVSTLFLGNNFFGRAPQWSDAVNIISFNWLWWGFDFVPIWVFGPCHNLSIQVWSLFF